jgi:hypothetical protein
MKWEPSVAPLIGKTFTKVHSYGEFDCNPCITFEVNDEIEYILGKRQDCCESFYLDEVHGDLSDLENTPIIQAEESTGSIPTASESGTWTFYKLATIKGHVTIRFGGESNGYYSEAASLYSKEKQNA